MPIDLKEQVMDLEKDILELDIELLVKESIMEALDDSNISREMIEYFIGQTVEDYKKEI